MNFLLSENQRKRYDEYLKIQQQIRIEKMINKWNKNIHYMNEIIYWGKWVLCDIIGYMVIWAIWCVNG